MLHILQFVELDAPTISSYQLTCRANREWKKKELKEFEWEWRWEKIEKIVGKNKTDQMKQGAALKRLDLRSNQIDAKACEHLAPALAKMTALETLNLRYNQIDATGEEMMREAWKKAGKEGGLYI